MRFHVVLISRLFPIPYNKSNSFLLLSSNHCDKPPFIQSFAIVFFFPSVFSVAILSFGEQKELIDSGKTTTRVGRGNDDGGSGGGGGDVKPFD